VTLSEADERVGIAPATLRRRIGRGHLKGVSASTEVFVAHSRGEEEEA